MVTGTTQSGAAPNIAAGYSGREMSFTRRTLLVGAASGFSVLVLSACTDEADAPTPTATPTASVGSIPAEKMFHRSNWANDPYAYGATSYLAVGALPQSREVLRQPVLDRVFLAGEAFSDDPGTIRGAIASGRSAASLLAEAMEKGERVAVIGAGAAGAAAARVLAASGAEVIVVEARDRTGGRVDSYVIDDEASFELGAWRVLDDADESIVEALAREGVDVVPLTGATAYALQGETAIAELNADDPAVLAAAASLESASVWAQQQLHDVPFAEALREGGGLGDWPAAAVGEVTSDAIAGQLLLSASGLTGADPAELSAWFSTPALGLGSLVPTGPLSTFIDAALEDIDTVVSTVVVGVFYDESGVSLRLGTGEALSVDRVLVTVPLGVLQQQLIEFDPPLPLAHRGALDALSVGHIEVVRLEFETAFWNTEAVWWVHDDDVQQIRLWVNLLPATGRAVLLGVVGGQRALDLAEASDDDVREAALRSLAPFVQSTP